MQHWVAYMLAGGFDAHSSRKRQEITSLHVTIDILYLNCCDGRGCDDFD